MIDKRVVFCLLLVILLVFTVVSVYLFKQWKHLPQFLLQSSPLRIQKTKSGTQEEPVAAVKKQSLLKSNQPNQPHQTHQPNQPIQPHQPHQQVQRTPFHLLAQQQPIRITQEVITPSSVLNTCQASSKPPDRPPLTQNVVPLLKTPEILPEPNFVCPTFAPRVEKEYVVYADSACRDLKLYPTSQEYYFKFPLPLYNVTSVDIIQAIIPRGEYEVNRNNNIFYVEEPPNPPLPVTLNIGDYITEIGLAAEITTQMNAAGLLNTYLVTAYQYKLTFTRTAGVLPFQLLLTNVNYTPSEPIEYDPYGLVRQLLGFPPGVISDVGGVIQAPFFTGQNSIQYVDVVSPDISKNYYDSPEIARIPVLGSGLNGVTEYDPQTIGSRKFWPIQRLTGLMLQFFVGPTCPPQSVLYNFNGMDNSLTLRITCQEYKNVFIDDFCIEQMV